MFDEQKKEFLLSELKRYEELEKRFEEFKKILNSVKGVKKTVEFLTVAEMP